MKLKSVLSSAIRLVGCFVLIIIMMTPSISFAAEMREEEPEDIVATLKHYLIETVDDIDVEEDDHVISPLDENEVTKLIFDGENYDGMTALEAAGALWECGGILQEFTEDTLEVSDEFADLTFTFGIAFVMSYLAAIMIYAGFITAVIGVVVTLISLILALCGKSMGKDSLGNLTQGLWSVFGALALAQPMISLAVNVFFRRFSIIDGIECRFRIFFEGGAHYLVALIVVLLVTVIAEAVVKKIFSKESD